MNHEQSSISRNPEERTPIHFRTGCGANRLEDRLPKGPDTEARGSPMRIHTCSCVKHTVPSRTSAHTDRASGRAWERPLPGPDSSSLISPRVNLRPEKRRTGSTGTQRRCGVFRSPGSGVIYRYMMNGTSDSIHLGVDQRSIKCQEIYYETGLFNVGDFLMVHCAMVFNIISVLFGVSSLY